MIRKLIRQMLTAQILSALTVSLCLLIDSIMIGRFLGVEAIAAYQLANPILLIVGALGTMLSAGVQVACSKSLGRGSQEETNAGFSCALVLTFAVSVPLLLIVFFLRAPIAAAMGAGTSGSLFDQTQNYLAGFIIGAPASMGALILVPFLQMAGQSSLLIAAVLGMTVADVGLDLLNVFVFHGGMFGMGLASSLSYYAAVIIGCFYFLSKKSVFRFSRKLVSKKKIAELLRSGVPSVFTMASTVILIFLLNAILLGTGGSDAVAAYSVVSTVGNASNCIATGIGGVSLTLAGILYNEEDRKGLKELARRLCLDSVFLGVGVGVLLLLFAPAFVSLFIPGAGETQDMAILGVRLFAAGLVPCCVASALKNAYQVMGRVLLTELISLFEGAFFPVLAAFVFSRFFGTTGVWLYFVIGETVALVAVFVYIRIVMKKHPWKDGAYLLLKPDFSVPDKDLLEADLTTVEEMADVVQKVQSFCKARGADELLANRVALCVEEMAGNTILHGFVKDQKPHHLSVRVMRKKDEWILRFRDDCRTFDPIHYIPKEGKDALGIRLMLKLATTAQYTYSLNLNNLTLRLSAAGK